jgi:hypothetical protein
MGRAGARGRASLHVIAAIVLAGALLPAARSDADDFCGPSRYSRGGHCDCDSRPACANGWAYAPWRRGDTFVRSRWGGGYGSWTGYRGSGSGAPCAAPFRPRCGYRFYAGARGSSHTYYVRSLWSSYAHAGPMTSGQEPVAEADVPAVPLGKRPAAHDALFHGRAEDAVSRFEALVVEDANDADAYVGLLHARFLKGDFTGAAAALRSAALLGAVSPHLRLDVAAAYEKAESFRARLSGLRARVRFALDDASARVLLAYFESGLGETDDARLDARLVLRSRPNDPAAKALLGQPPEAPAAPPQSK